MGWHPSKATMTIRRMGRECAGPPPWHKDEDRTFSAIADRPRASAADPRAELLVSQLLVADAVGLGGLGAEAALAVGLVVLVVALEPDHPAVPLEGQHVSGDAVQEPAVVADHHHAAGEGEHRLLE